MPKQAFILFSLCKIKTSRGVLPTIKKLWFGRSLTLETLSSGWYWLSSLITRLTDVNFASASQKIIGTLLGKLKLEGLERVGDPEELAELLPGGV